MPERQGESQSYDNDNEGDIKYHVSKHRSIEIGNLSYNIWEHV